MYRTTWSVVQIGMIAMLLCATSISRGQGRNNALWRTLPKPHAAPKRRVIPQHAVTIWAESNQARILDFEFSADGESILALTSGPFLKDEADNGFRVLSWERAGHEPQVLRRFPKQVTRLAVSPNGDVAISRLERRKTESDASYRRGRKGWEDFSIAEIYESNLNQEPAKTLEFNYGWAHQRLNYGGSGKWLAFGPVVYSTADWDEAWVRSGNRRSPNRWALHRTLDRLVYATPSFVDWTAGTNPSVTVYDLEQRKVVSEAGEALRTQVRQIAIYKDAVDVLGWRADGSGVLMANGRSFIEAPFGDVPAEEASHRFTHPMLGRRDAVTQLGVSADGNWTIVAYEEHVGRILLLNAKFDRGFYLNGWSFRTHRSKPELLVHQRIYPSTNGASLTRDSLFVVDLSKLVAAK